MKTGQQCYEEFVATLLRPDALPYWHELPERLQARWDASAAALKSTGDPEDFVIPRGKWKNRTVRSMSLRELHSSFGGFNASVSEDALAIATILKRAIDGRDRPRERQL